jgi:hypothetical protein
MGTLGSTLAAADGDRTRHHRLGSAKAT